MDFQQIDKLISDYVKNDELASASIIVRKDADVVYKNKFGYSCKESKKEIEYNSIFRLMSMSKIITAVGVLKLVDQGKLSIDDPLSKFIPKFKDIRVVSDKRYDITKKSGPLSNLFKLLTFNPKKVNSAPAKREVTIRDLLSHSSGIQQGVYGFLRFLKEKDERTTLQDTVDNYYCSYLLDFNPGEGTGYSPLAGFDILGRVIEVVSEKSFSQYLKDEIFTPLNMKDTFFYPESEDQKNRIVDLYKRKGKKLINVTNSSKQNEESMLHRGKQGYCAGSGGLYSTLFDYDNLVSMLLADGLYNGNQFLSKEIVDRMHTQGAEKLLEAWPGQVWGLGVNIRIDPEKGNLFVPKDTYGWSGAYGTHFFVSPREKISVVFMTNRTDLGGSSSYVSSKLEEVLFKQCL